jgi:hypothetical protein
VLLLAAFVLLLVCASFGAGVLFLVGSSGFLILICIACGARMPSKIPGRDTIPYVAISLALAAVIVARRNTSKRALRNRIALLILVGSAALPCVADPLTAFTSCIGATGHDPVCRIDAGTYAITTSLVIDRSNITLEGATENASDTTFVRAAGFTGALLQDPLPGSASLHSVTIKNLTLDGNRQQQSGTFGDFAPDAAFYSTKGILFTNLRFLNSPNISLGFSGSGTGRVLIYASIFRNSTAQTVWSDAYGQGGTGCASGTLPDNIVIAASYFQDAGESAVALNATNILVLDNIFEHNKWNTTPFGDSGGQINFYECSNGVAAVGNTVRDGIVGANGQTADGIEVHAKNVLLVNNVIRNNAGSGITLGGAQHVFIANWNRATSTSANGIAGVYIYNDRADRTTEWVTIEGANVTDQRTGVLFGSQNGVPLNHMTVTNNCLADDIQPILLSVMGPDVIIANNLTRDCGPR